MPCGMTDTVLVWLNPNTLAYAHNDVYARMGACVTAITPPCTYASMPSCTPACMRMYAACTLARSCISAVRYAAVRWRRGWVRAERRQHGMASISSDIMHRL